MEPPPEEEAPTQRTDAPAAAAGVAPRRGREAPPKGRGRRRLWSPHILGLGVRDRPAPSGLQTWVTMLAPTRVPRGPSAQAAKEGPARAPSPHREPP